MSQKKVELKHDQLLSARQNARSEQATGKIRAHGKLWGMDVFSWSNPSPELVASTINSFPYPVIWIGNQDLFEWCASHFPNICVNVKTIIAQDRSYDVYSEANKLDVETMIGAGSAENSFELMKHHITKGAILFCTNTGIEWERNQKLFEEFVKLHQAK